ncbi:MAG: hypothetical protein JOZ41_07645 [Chloroflexi bacterium]|nr:hypothetical protein [Chloroflexota bacterium]
MKEAALLLALSLVAAVVLAYVLVQVPPGAVLLGLAACLIVGLWLWAVISPPDLDR